MVEKLRRGGIRAISPVVDVTNYVLLELGQPMHGFDLARLDGGIRVRMAEPGERLTLLDGSELELTPETLVIADARRALALAGIMGGVDSGVTDQTVDILLESAFFAPLAIAGKARGYGLHTDSSHRFERGVDPQLQVSALERATGLLLGIVGGEPGPVVELASAAHLPVARPIGLRRARVGRVLGVTIDDAEIEDILTRLGMRLTPVADGWEVVAPSARFDIAIEVDLIEEIGRIYGYARIPENLSSAPVSVVATPEAQFSLQRAKQLLVDRDYQEAVTYSFISPDMAARLTPDAEPITLANPISADMAVMRASLWPGLLGALRYNQARQQERVRLFESGLTFRRVADGLEQEPQLAGVVYGAAQHEQWGEAPRPVDFYDLKADVEAVLAQAGIAGELQFEPAEHRALHPGQAARVRRGAALVGHLGMLHPALQAELDLPGSVFLFELALRPLTEGRLPRFAPLSKFPAIRRDLAIVVERAVSFAAVRDCARRAAPDIVRDIRLFDVYTGDKIDSGLKSLALGLILQESSHTLTDQEVDRAMAVVREALAEELAARLRD
jgi:phenylalanyl-tRNA synthetase beta chain